MNGSRILANTQILDSSHHGQISSVQSLQNMEIHSTAQRGNGNDKDPDNMDTTLDNPISDEHRSTTSLGRSGETSIAVQIQPDSMAHQARMDTDSSTMVEPLGKTPHMGCLRVFAFKICVNVRTWGS